MYTHNQTNWDMPLNDLVDYSHLPRWTNLNNLNFHSVLPDPEETIRTNGFVKRQQKTHYGKGAVTQFDNCCASMGNPDSQTEMKYPRIFRPVILQHHPEYSSRMLPQTHDLHQTILLDRKPLTSNDREKRENPDFLHNLGSHEEMDKQDDGQFYKRVFQFQLSISESLKENSNFLGRPDSEMTSQFLTLNNPEGNLQPMNSDVKPTQLDFPYVPETNRQSVNRQDRWEPFQNHQFNMRMGEVENISFKGQMCPYRNPDAHKELIPNWLPPTKQNIILHDRTDRIQPYYAGVTNWTDSISLNPFNPMNDLANDEAFSKRSAFWKPMFILENYENSFGNIHNIFDRNSEQSAVLSNGNSSRPYYTPPQKRAMSKKLNMCPYCNRSNPSPAQLKIHLRVHTGERPYVCDNVGCDKTFTRNEELTRHLKIHSGDRPYVCNICQRSFGRKDHLTKHEVTHRSASDKKVHICLVAGCKQRYTRSDALARHRWNVHFIRPQVRIIGARKNQTRNKQQD